MQMAEGMKQKTGENFNGKGWGKQKILDVGTEISISDRQGAVLRALGELKSSPNFFAFVPRNRYILLAQGLLTANATLFLF